MSLQTWWEANPTVHNDEVSQSDGQQTTSFQEPRWKIRQPITTLIGFFFFFTYRLYRNDRYLHKVVLKFVSYNME